MNNIETRLDLIRKNLPESNSLAELISRNKKAHKFKLTFRLVTTKNAIEWRVVDLLSQAIRLYKSDMILPAIILVRSSMETVCLLSYINKMTHNVVNNRVSFHDFNVITERVFAGSKVEEELPDPINVITTIEKSDEKHPGILESYNFLCENAHPNLYGVVSSYTTLDHEKYSATYGIHWKDIHKQQTKVALNLCLDVFEGEVETWGKRFKKLEKWLAKNSFKLKRQLEKINKRKK